eukprot:6273893-Pyramimonas_sp.AAC.1
MANLEAVQPIPLLRNRLAKDVQHRTQGPPLQDLAPTIPGPCPSRCRTTCPSARPRPPGPVTASE